MSSTTTPARAIIFGPTVAFAVSTIPRNTGSSRTEPRFSTFDVTGTGQQPQRQQPDHAAADHRQPPLLVTEMHVDGFRFDLAAALARQFYDVDRLSAFFDIIHQDPVLSRVKLDRRAVGCRRGGYTWATSPVRGRSGTAPIADTVRDFWRGAAGGVRDIANCLTGSSSSIQWDGRQPWGGASTS